MLSSAVREKEDFKKEKAISIAFGEAAKYGLYGLATGVAVLAAGSRTKLFLKYLSVSAKTAIPLMSGLFAYAVKYELCLIDTQRNPELYGLTDEHIRLGKVTRMPAHHRAMNYVFDHPFSLVLALSVPIASTIFYTQMQHTHLTLSQKVMHSRVFSQGGIIMVALSTMAFRDYMSKRGRFDEPDDEKDIV